MPGHCIHFVVVIMLAGLIFSSATFAAATNPSIYWLSEPVQPGSAVLVTGDNLLSVSAIRVNSVELPSGRRVAAKAEAPILKRSLNTLIFELPSDLPPGRYEAEFQFDSGALTVYVNAPHVNWHILEHSKWRAKRLRVFGTSLDNCGRATLQLAGSDKVVQTVQSSKTTPWELSFELPQLAPGSYRAELRIGNCGITQLDPIKIRSDGQKHVFRTQDFGAVGDGEVDDTRAIQATIAAAGEANGGVVLIGPGRYVMSSGLVIPPGVEIEGESRGDVALLWRDLETPPPALILGSSHFAIRRLSIYAQRHNHVIANFLAYAEAVEGDVEVDDVLIRASAYYGRISPDDVFARLKRYTATYTGAPDSIRLSGKNLSVHGVDVSGTGRSILIYHGKNVVVSGSNLRNGRWGWYSVSGSENVLIEDNTISGGDLMSSGGGINALYSNRGSRNVVFQFNQVTDLFGWDREALTSDGGKGLYYGPIRPSGDRYAVELSREAPSSDWIGATVFLLEGAGTGQWAHITGANRSGLTLDRPFTVAPSESTVATIVPTQEGYFILNNVFRDARIGVQFFGTSLHHVVANNRFIRTGGIAVQGLWYNHFQPSWYCQYLGNDIQEPIVFPAFGAPPTAQSLGGIFLTGTPRPPNRSPLIRGAVIRNNHLAGAAEIRIVGKSRATPGVEDVLLEGNQFDGATTARILADEGSVGVFAH